MAIANFVNGDTRRWDITVKDKDNVALDITGYVLYMTFKINIADADTDPGVVQLTGVIDDAAGGLGHFLMTSTISKPMNGTYNYDVQVADASTPPEVTTIETGTVKVSQGVTIADT